MEEDASLKEIKRGAAIHGTFDGFEVVDVSFEDAVAVGDGACLLDRLELDEKAIRKGGNGGKRRGASAVDPSREALGKTLDEELGEVGDEVDERGECRGMRAEGVEVPLLFGVKRGRRANHEEGHGARRAFEEGKAVLRSVEEIFEHLAQIGEEVKAINDLDGLGSARIGSRAHGSGAIAAEKLDGRILTKASGDGGRRAIGKEVKGLRRVKIDDDRTIGVAFPPSPIIDANGSWSRRGSWKGRLANDTKEAIAAGRCRERVGDASRREASR